jgi:hypothetical protein
MDARFRLTDDFFFLLRRAGCLRRLIRSDGGDVTLALAGFVFSIGPLPWGLRPPPCQGHRVGSLGVPLGALFLSFPVSRCGPGPIAPLCWLLGLGVTGLMLGAEFGGCRGRSELAAEGGRLRSGSGALEVCTVASLEEGVWLGMLCWVTGGSKSRCRLSRTVSVVESGSSPLISLSRAAGWGSGAPTCDCRLAQTVSVVESVSSSSPLTFPSRVAGWGSGAPTGDCVTSSSRCWSRPC